MCLSLDSEIAKDDVVSIIAKAIKQQIQNLPDHSPASENHGIFDSVDEAICKAEQAYHQLERMSLAKRGQIIELIRQKTRENAERLSLLELEETGMGRYSHKVAKHMLVADKTPGLEDILPEAMSGDDGLTVVERRPFGVAGCIMPSTAPSTTTIHNSICMIAAGNAVVMSPHPGGKNTTFEAVKMINEAIREAGGPDNLVVCTREASIQNTQAMMSHPKVDFLLATGGPGIVREILASGKKGIGAGPGNPPVLVDETADIIKAGKDIVEGCYFENCLQCIGEKECFVVECVADELIQEMQRNGAYLIRDEATIQKLTDLLTGKDGPNKAYIGKDAAVILSALGIEAGFDPKIIIFEVPDSHITVQDEYLMPLLPVVRVKDVDEGIRLAVIAEGRRRHSAMIHSKNVRNITKYAQVIQTTILVKNGPSYAGVGLGGEGYVSLSIAGPTGEGLTSPKTFTRPQRCIMVDDFSLRSALKLGQ